MPSTLRAEVVRIGALEKHPDADTLSITSVYGYPLVVKSDAFKEGDLAVYVPVDAMVPTYCSSFSFLQDKANADGFARIKPMKLRGIFSMGLLVPLTREADSFFLEEYVREPFEPSGKLLYVNWPVAEGDDVTERLGITKYEPPPAHQPGVSFGRANEETPPAFSIGYTGIEHLRRHAALFSSDEIVFATEKVHGANARYSYQDGRTNLGSHKRWLKEDGDSIWHKALEKYPQVKDFCWKHEGCILFGEVFGRVQDLRYGRENDVDFVAFDVWDPTRPGGGYWDFNEFREAMKAAGIPTAPIVYSGGFDFDRIQKLAEGDSLVATVPQIMEGVVVRPETERWDRKTGRVVLKLHSERYLLRKGADKEVEHA